MTLLRELFELETKGSYYAWGFMQGAAWLFLVLQIAENV